MGSPRLLCWSLLRLVWLGSLVRLFVSPSAQLCFAWLVWLVLLSRFGSGSFGFLDSRCDVVVFCFCVSVFPSLLYQISAIPEVPFCPVIWGSGSLGSALWLCSLSLPRLGCFAWLVWLALWFSLGSALFCLVRLARSSLLVFAPACPARLSWSALWVSLGSALFCLAFLPSPLY